MGFCGLIVVALVAAGTEGPAGRGQAAEVVTLSRLRVSDNQRFLATEEGKPFFYLADTAWELFHRLKRDEVIAYLDDRASKGFTVIQCVALAELDGLTEPNALGYLPLIDTNDVTKPAVVDGPNNDYWDHVEDVMKLAEERGLYLGFLPMWGKYAPTDTGSAAIYGEFLGARYRERSNLIWILGGDRPAPTSGEQDVWRAMAKGIAIGVSGSEDYDRVLMTYHTYGPDHASKYFHADRWLDFTSIQSSHGDAVLNWKMIEQDYARQPAKPVIDLETTYPDLVILKGMKEGNDDHARRSAYWAVFAGACGHTYGHNSIWQMYEPGRKPILNARKSWRQALAAPSSTQMGYLRKLMESRTIFDRVPDQSLLESDPGEGIDRIEATRGADYAFIYTPEGRNFAIATDKLAGRRSRVRWFDPRTGEWTEGQTITNDGRREFDPPGEPGLGRDWVLVLDRAY